MTNPKGGPEPKRDAPNYSTSTSTGIEPNVAAALAYALWIVTGLLFYVLEKENRFVRFHAAQSITISLLLIVINLGMRLVGGVLAFIPFLGPLAVFLLTFGLWIATFALWLFLMWKAYQGEEWEFPFAADYARKMV